ncbi:MAG TPA: M23 family metallopeptidase [Ktedonosporobacter sp.]|nr:M23 family metallopeptidase [Ktedonosporobacter sp.]
MLSSPEDQDTHPLPRVKRMDALPSPTIQVQQVEQMEAQPSPTRQLYIIQHYPAKTTDALPGQTSAHLPVLRSSTGQLPGSSSLTTRKLPESTSPLTATRRLTHIPATQKRRPLPQAAPASRRRLTARLFTVLVSTLAVLAIATFFATPLGQSDQQNFTQVLQNLLSSNPVNTFNAPQQVAPTPTPARLTNEGACGGSDIWGTCATEITASGTMGTGYMGPPINGATITQVYGNPEYQSWCGCIKPHSGVDLAAPYGTPIVAADSGQVIWTGWDWSGLGWAVKINHGHFIATIYGHLARFIVMKGQNVMKGDVIGYEGSTGASTGPHVHFMVLVNNIWVNPTRYVQLP